MLIKNIYVKLQQQTHVFFLFHKNASNLKIEYLSSISFKLSIFFFGLKKSFTLTSKFEAFSHN